MKVLILTADFGNGHIQVAKALKFAFEHFSGAEIIVKNLFYETNPRFHKWSKRVYLKSFTKSGRQLYRLFYYTSKKMSKYKKLHIFSYGYSHLEELIRVEEPDLIINTFPSFAAPNFILKGNRYIPCYNVITDYCLHDSWVHPYIEKYYVSTSSVKQQLMNKGVLMEKICVTGIPILKEYEQPQLTSSVYKKYKLVEGKKIVLVVAGAYGVSKEMEYICNKLKEANTFQLVIICGNNDRLRDHYIQRFQFDHHVYVLGFVENMAELMKVSTLIITKPGGIVLTEALAINIPIILTKAIPGQESENATYFEKTGAALLSKNNKQLIEQTLNIINDDEAIIKMKQAQSAIYKPNAAKKIVQDVFSNLQWRKTFQSMIK